jgi:hypothetical protein
MMIDIRQPGGGLCDGIFSSWQGWHCVWVLCALPCAKNCVGQYGKVLGRVKQKRCVSIGCHATLKALRRLGEMFCCSHRSLKTRLVEA